MLPLASLLERFKHIVPTERVTRGTVLLVVQEVCGITLRDQDVRIQQGVVFLAVHPIHKNEILLQKKNVLDTLNKKHLVSIRDMR